MSDIFFGIKLATYFRKDGSTYEKIERCINSIKSQTYKNWKIFLVGDGYTNHEEFNRICNLVDKEKITSINLRFGHERDILKLSGTKLWSCGGVFASNTSMDMMYSENIKFYSCIDDDDEWLPNHLQVLADSYKSFPDSCFLYTKSYYLNTILPLENNVPLMYNNLLPRCGNIVHASVSWNLEKINLRYRNINDQKRIYPSDADMWERVTDFCARENLKIMHIPLITVRKFDEASILK